MGQGLLPNPIGAISGYVANKRNRRATRRATAEALADIGRTERNQIAQQRMASDLAGDFREEATDRLRGGFRTANFFQNRAEQDIHRLMDVGTDFSNNIFQQGLDTATGTLQQGINSVDLGAPIEADAGFRFQREQGERAIGALSSAQGGFGGGAQLKELARFNQGLAATHAQDVFNRRFAQRGQNIGAAQSLSSLQLGGAAQVADRTLGRANIMAGLARDEGNRRAQQALARTQSEIGFMDQTARNQINALNNISTIQGNNINLRSGLIMGQAAGAGMAPLIAAQGLGGDLDELTGVAGGLVGAAAGKAGLA